MLNLLCIDSLSLFNGNSIVSILSPSVMDSCEILNEKEGAGVRIVGSMSKTDGLRQRVSMFDTWIDKIFVWIHLSLTHHDHA